MTVKELIKLLEMYPPDAEVKSKFDLQGGASTLLEIRGDTVTGELPHIVKHVVVIE